MSPDPLTLPERHHAARVLHELTRPPGAAVVASFPASRDPSVSAQASRGSTGLAVKEFWTAVGRLEALGVLTRRGDTLRLDRDRLDRLATRWVSDSPLASLVDSRPRLAAFVQWGRVTRMPVDPGLIDELYAGLAELVRPGETLAEPELNARIAAVHDDPAEVRRALVDRGLLRRDPGSSAYRRPGPAASCQETPNRSSTQPKGPKP